MTEQLRLVFVPVLPPTLFEIMAALAAILVLYALWRRAKGAFGRMAALGLLFFMLVNPSLVREQHAPLKDTVLVVTDESTSMRLDDRPQQIRQAIEALQKKLETFSDLDVQTVVVKGTTETDLFRALENKLASIPPDRLAGVIILTDGEIHDKPQSRLPEPVHVLLAGHRREIDRRLVVVEAPAYGLVGKTVSLALRVDDYPAPQSETASINFQRGDGTGQIFTVPVGKTMKFDVPVEHAGQNLFAFSTDALPGELTPINNRTAVSVNGIRDRLRVLLVSGEPHIGGRTWRNFLKADPAVDLIHFTILRSPNKFDSVPNSELALITFPVHELFDSKLNSFDLIIFDRFKRQSLIPDEYLENIARYVEHGGALLLSSATDESIPSLTQSPLARVLPAEPTGQLLTGAFVPALTDAGRRHPVTSALPRAQAEADWGSWYRQVEAHALRGDVLMSGLNNTPLLVLDRVGDGRVAQFLSDQFWLWSRETPDANGKGGGPQAELLRRTAHWLVKEPELDETALRARAEITSEGWNLIVTKQTLRDDSLDVTVTDPDNQTSSQQLKSGRQPGILETVVPVTKMGLYRIKQGTADGHEREVLVLVGPMNAPEFGDMFATDAKIKVLISNSGGLIWLEDGVPDIKRTNLNGPQNGWNWIGLKRNDQYHVTGSQAYPLCPPWLAVIILLAAVMLTWRREGRS